MNNMGIGVAGEPAARNVRLGQTGRGKLILLVEDDEGDQLLTREALAETDSPLEAVMVSDGEEALDYLRRKGEHADAALRTIPVVILSTSDYEEDVAKCYHAGVNSYVRKPTDFDEFVAVIAAIEHYWFHVVEPPPKG